MCLLVILDRGEKRTKSRKLRGKAGMSENDCAGLRGHKLKAKKDGTNFLLFVPGGQ